MNRRQLLILGAIALVIIILIVLLSWLGLANKQSADGDVNGVKYTDTISGQNLTAFPETSSTHGDGDSGPTPINEAGVTGMDDFFATIGQDESSNILSDLIAFIRARSGTAAGATAAVLDGKVTQTGTNPTVYQFTLVLQQSDAHYKVTITMPTTATTPEITFEGVTQ